MHFMYLLHGRRNYMKSMNINQKSTLDIFLELASMKIENEASGPSVYAGGLYKWLELIKSCRLMCGGVSLRQEEQQQKVARVLNKDTKQAKLMLQNIQKCIVGAIGTFKKREAVTPAYPMIATIDFDSEDRMVFHFGLLATTKAKTDEFGVVLTIFMNLIGHMHLEPERFRICPKCGKHFYQYQRKSQKYCSKSCSDMGRSGKSFAD